MFQSLQRNVQCTALGIVPEPFLVLFRPGTTSVRSGPVRSGLGTFLFQSRNIHRTKSWCVAHGGRWEVVKERVRTADERRSVPYTWHLTIGCLKQSQLPPPNRLGNRPSIHTTANDHGLRRTGRRANGNAAVLATHEAFPHRCHRRWLEQERCWVGKVQIKQCGIVTQSWSCML